VLSHVPKQFLSMSSSLSLSQRSGTGLQRVAAGMADTQLSAQLEAHYQQYDVVSKQACARLTAVWDMLELSAEEQSAELAKAAQKALEVWAAACTDADRRVDAVRSSIEDMRREVQKTRDALKLGEARQLQLTSMGFKATYQDATPGSAQGPHPGSQPKQCGGCAGRRLPARQPGARGPEVDADARVQRRARGAGGLARQEGAGHKRARTPAGAHLCIRSFHVSFQRCLLSAGWSAVQTSL